MVVTVNDIVSNGIHHAETAQPSQVATDNLTPADLLSAARVRPTDVIKENQVVLWVKGEPNPVDFGTLGDFSMITGKAKSKKSFTICLAIAAAIDGSQYNIGPFVCKLPPDKRRVVYFDTEQGRHRVLRALRRVCRMAGIDDPKDLEYYDLRGFDTLTRVAMIEHCLNEANPDKNIGLVVVDGCRDLVHDFNDPKEASKLATHFMQWTANNGLHLITVLHQNKGDNNARGHVGSELTNKAEAVITVEVDKQDKAVSIVEPAECRDIAFEGFAFMVNADGLPELLQDYQISGKGAETKKKFDQYQYQPEIHKEILSKVFTSKEIGYKDFQNMLRVEWGAYGQKISNQATQELITYYHHKMKWVGHNGKQGRAAKYTY